MSAEEIRKLMNLLEGRGRDSRDPNAGKQEAAEQFIKSKGFTTQRRGSVTTINTLDGHPVTTSMSAEEFDKQLEKDVFLGI
jgi:hypothetical protein